jgi:tetratricopeptide (TPR) repeat protein
MRALVRVAEIHGRRGEFRQGLAFARRALDSVMYDPEANYVYGLLSRKHGDLVDAKETFGWAARSLEFRSNAYCQIAEIGIIEGELEKAIEYAGRALDFNRYNLRAHEVLAIACRRAGRSDRAAAALAELQSIDPLNHIARFERALAESSAGDLEAFKAMIGNEFPHETYLEAALSYVELGLEKEALALLEGAPDSPIVDYWIAYLLRDSAPAQSESRLEKAGKQSPRLVFPFRTETIPVLRWAAVKMASDWKPRYYLGLIDWSKGRLEDARRAFDACGSVDFAPFHLALGHLDPSNALEHFTRALETDEGEWRAWHGRSDRLIVMERTTEALEVTGKALERFPGHMVLAMDRARALHQAGRYGDCLALLEMLEVLPYEGAWEAHDLFVRSHLRLAMQSISDEKYPQALEHLDAGRKYPEHLGTGRPFDPDFRLHDFLAALCRERMDDADGAARLREEIIDYTQRSGTGRNPLDGLGIVVMNRFGDGTEARKLLKSLETRFPEDPVLAWSRAVLSGKSGEEEAIAAGRRRNQRFRIVVEAAALITSGSERPSGPHPDR